MKINQFVPDNKIFDSVNSIDSKKGQEEDQNSSSLSFGDIIKSKLNEVNNAQIAADDKAKQLVKGDDVDIHDVMLADEEAKMSLEMAVQVRNKILDAYQELNRMQL